MVMVLIAAYLYVMGAINMMAAVAERSDGKLGIIVMGVCWPVVVPIAIAAVLAGGGRA